MAFPGWVNEYSTARGFELVVFLAINPEHSRLRRVLVSIRCETPLETAPQLSVSIRSFQKCRWLSGQSFCCNRKGARL
jgi:hypothetical protein